MTDLQRDYLASTVEGAALLENLDERIADVEQRWGVRVGGPAGDGATSVALRATAADGTPLVVKFDPDVQRAVAQAKVLSAWASRGLAPEVVAEDVGVYAMMWSSAKPLPRPLPIEFETQFAAAAETFVAAWHTPSPDGFELVDRFEWVLDLNEERHASTPVFDPGVFDRARTLVAELRAGHPNGLCHGDPVPSNVLFDGSQAVLIDPVPNVDTLRCAAVHWAVRACDGFHFNKWLPLALSVAGLDEDGTSELWAAVLLMPYVVYRKWRGMNVPSQMLEVCAPLM